MANESVVWTHDTNGSITLQGTSSIYVLRERKNLEYPPVILTREKAPGGYGSRLLNVTVGERIVNLPLLLTASTPSEMLTLRANLNKVFNPIDGGGILKWTNQSGVTRWLYARYLSGLEGDDAEATPTWAKVNVSLLAVDPFWYSASTSSVVFGGGTPVAFLGDPFLPLNISESSISDSQYANNSGDIECWPEITILGPASSIIITNTTTGKKLDLTQGSGLTLGAGDRAYIGTAPGSRKVYDPDTPTTNYFSYLTADSSFFPLIPGTNQLTISSSGTTSASRISIVFRPAYTLK